MLQSGLSRELFEAWCTEPLNGVIIADFAVQGTLAREILTDCKSITSRAGTELPLKMSVDAISFSAHADYPQTQQFLAGGVLSTCTRPTLHLLLLLCTSVCTGVIENKHSTHVESPPPPYTPRVCMSIHPKGKSCSNLGRVRVLNDPAARATWSSSARCTTRRR